MQHSPDIGDMMIKHILRTHVVNQGQVGISIMVVQDEETC